MAIRVAIATIGTQGDVQPYVALALKLRERGVDVVIGANENFEEFVTGRGIEFHCLGPDIRTFLTQQRFEKAMSANAISNVPMLLLEGQRMVEMAGTAAWEMTQGCDAIVMNINTSFGIDIAEALDIPPIMSAFLPLKETGEFALSAFSVPDMGQALNKLSYVAVTAQQAYYNLPRDTLRKNLMGLGPRKWVGFFKDNAGRDLSTLYAYSSLVSPRPADWPRESIITGYWRLPDNSGWEPSARFQAFLEAGSKPVYIGFGSMPFGAERNTQVLKEAVTKWGGRAVVARGWGGIDPNELPESIYAIGYAPHDRLFEHVAAVVHHGGAGTTSAGLTAGRPTFIVPQALDQPFWGHRVSRLACGPEPVPLSKLTPDLLARALGELTSNEVYKSSAAVLGERLQAEDGAGVAADSILRTIADYQRSAKRNRVPLR